MQWCKTRFESWAIFWAMILMGFGLRMIWIADGIWEFGNLPILSMLWMNAVFSFTYHLGIRIAVACSWSRRIFLTPTSVSLILFTIMVTEIRVRNIYSCEEVVKTIDRCENLYSKVFMMVWIPLSLWKRGAPFQIKLKLLHNSRTNLASGTKFSMWRFFLLTIKVSMVVQDHCSPFT